MATAKARRWIVLGGSARVDRNTIRGERCVVAQEPISQGKAVTIWAIYFIVSFAGTAGVMWIYHPDDNPLLGPVMMIGLFVCWAVLGARVDRQKMKGGVTEGIAALAEAGSFYLIIIIGIELVCIVLGWQWLWRTIIPLALGIFAGYTWARREPELEMPEKKTEDEKEPVDLWKP
jgi:hypothetical protein